MGFNEDLQLGEKAERYVIEQLKEEFPTLKKMEGYNPDYDLIDESGYTFEVKLDIRSKETSNIGIEYEHGGELTAISKSKAIEWIVIYYSDHWKYIRETTINLRSFIKNNWTFFRKIKGVGDKSSLVLIPVDILERCFSYNIYNHIDNT